MSIAEMRSAIASELHGDPSRLRSAQAVLEPAEMLWLDIDAHGAIEAWKRIERGEEELPGATRRLDDRHRREAGGVSPQAVIARESGQSSNHRG